MPRPSSDDTRALGLAAVLGTAGVMHFVRPQFFDEIVPHRLPFPPRVWTYVSGVAELACAVAVARASRPTWWKPAPMTFAFCDCAMASLI